MPRETDTGNRTFDTVRGRFQAWRDQNPAPDSPSALGLPEMSEQTARLFGMAVGFGTGAFLLLLAAVTLYASTTWGAIDRFPAQVAYGASGFFLLIAGAGAIIATWNHVFRVLAGPPQHH